MVERPMFRPFDEAGSGRVYVRNLPHWRQPGATYFVTFRQDDSIPAGVLAQWRDDRQRWYRAHGLDPSWQHAASGRFDTAYAAILPGIRHAFERQQARLLHHELDRGHGSCVLRHPEPQTILAEALRFFDADRLWLGDFVVMPNHCHALILPRAEWELEDLIGSIKKWSARRIGCWLLQQPKTVQHSSRRGSKPRFWQHESYDHIVHDAEELAALRQYIARNPIEAGLPREAYLYYAAEWLDIFAPRSVQP